MIALLCFLVTLFASPFKPKSRLEAENAALRRQLVILQRKKRGRVHLTNGDRLFLVQLYRWFPSVLKTIAIIRPETIVRWHRAGFRRYWRWKSRSLGGRPQIAADLRALIRRMSAENQLWGAPRIHGELLKLGFEVSQSSIAKYMVKRCGPPSQGWRTFLRNHAPDIAAMDLFVIPTIGFDLLYAFIIVRLARRDLVWINVTPHPTADWIARQITEAFPWNEAPRYLIRDRDQIYGAAVRHRLRAMGIRDKPIATLGPMEVSYYKLASGSFSLANYRRKDGQPDVKRDWEAIEDAAACIAQAMKKDPDYGPVVLVIHDGPALGRIAKQNLAEFESNRAALRVVCSSLGSPDFHDPFIMGKNAADLIWDTQELRRECERRKTAPAALAAVADYTRRHSELFVRNGSRLLTPAETAKLSTVSSRPFSAACTPRGFFQKTT
jgi:hypothetical protein